MVTPYLLLLLLVPLLVGLKCTFYKATLPDACDTGYLVTAVGEPEVLGLRLPLPEGDCMMSDRIPELAACCTEEFVQEECNLLAYQGVGLEQVHCARVLNEAGEVIATDQTYRVD